MKQLGLVAEQVDALAHVAVAEFGRIDVWVNNAGIAIYGPLEVETLEQFRQINDVNATGTWLGCRAAARVMRTPEPLGRSRGHIVNVGSIEGEVGQGGLGAYAASKGRQLPEQLQVLLGKHPWPELGTPRDLAMAVAFLASDAAAWITGAVLPVDGGYLAT
jgi:NAD(P)-dependent dehydrogenase (short-subunit alcohol dehydrogenase family)